MITKLFKKLSSESRRRKMELLSRYGLVTPEKRILDLGAQLDSGPGLLLESAAKPENIVACNLGGDHLTRIAEAMPRVGLTIADARRLPFGDSAFGLVFSNAVIEHVGTFEDQRAMAEEIRRVGESWFVTTPNRWYPFEFHTRMPFYSWLPAGAMQRAGRIWSYNHVRKRYGSGIRREHTRLMTRRELKRLFPDSAVIPIRVTGMAETLVVVGPV